MKKRDLETRARVRPCGSKSSRIVSREREARNKGDKICSGPNAFIE